MWSEDSKKKDQNLYSRWELVPMDDGASTMLVNESVSDLSTMGTIANIMLKKVPALQVSIDLSKSMVLVKEIQKWAEGS